MTACPIRSFNDASRLFNICRSPEHPQDELHGRRARPDRVYRGEGLEPQQEDSRNAAIKCAKVQTLVKVINEGILEACRLSGRPVNQTVERIEAHATTSASRPAAKISFAWKDNPKASSAVGNAAGGYGSAGRPPPLPVHAGVAIDRTFRDR